MEHSDIACLKDRPEGMMVQPKANLTDLTDKGRLCWGGFCVANSEPKPSLALFGLREHLFRGARLSRFPGLDQSPRTRNRERTTDLKRRGLLQIHQLAKFSRDLNHARNLSAPSTF